METIKKESQLKLMVYEKKKQTKKLAFIRTVLR